mmetsp:Transcript_40845/g.116550  ORF Transcript_40845/g.116550 Transcript_40845/m.116550 type:complete len:224 (+) Transcript_40845:310-981(+)
MPSGRLQISMNVSPFCLLAAPWNSSTTPCTISAILFTNVMTFACRTSVAVLKSRMRQAPMTHSTLSPSIMASTFALSTPCMLCMMMFAPASPNPSASRDPSLMIVLSRMTVSMTSSAPDGLARQAMASQTCWSPFFFMFFVFRFCRALVISSMRNSWSATFIARRGFWRMVSTLSTMLSRCFSTRRCASLEMKYEATASAVHTKTVNSSELRLSLFTYGRRSK